MLPKSIDSHQGDDNESNSTDIEYENFEHENAFAIKKTYQRKRFCRIFKWFVKSEKFLLTGIYEYNRHTEHLRKREKIRAECGVITAVISERQW